jgi:7 transmembrane helices usually fused to an inactive transglutaminase/Inactive transglutaminase fused to 7 transmembrane helices
MRTLSVIVLSFILAALGLGVFLYKVKVLEFPLTPGEKYRSWYVESSFRLTPTDGVAGQPMQLSFFLPRANRHLGIVDENFVASGFGRTDSIEPESRNRTVTFSKRSARQAEIVLYRATIYSLDSGTGRQPKAPRPDLSYAPDNRKDLSRPAGDPLFVAIDSLLDEARSKSADTASMIRELYTLAQNREDDRSKIVAVEMNLGNSTPALATFLINTAGYPARTVHGVHLAAQKQRASLVQWTDVWLDGRWTPLNPKTGQAGLSGDYLPWWYGNDPFFHTRGADVSDVSVSVKSNLDNSITRALWKAEQQDNFFLQYSLFSLPISTQMLMQMLLLIPIGGLVIAVLRQVVGLTTFGTFMPVLVALAFRETGLVVGVVIFTLIVALGLLIRGWFNSLQLLLVPRLASVLTIVVLIIAVLTLVIHHMGLNVGLSLSLFPIVILTMTIERMSLLWEESGGNDAIMTGLGSLLASSLCYYAMYNPLVGHLVFAFPELLLTVLAVTILLGRYNGYKIAEYFRFRALERQIALSGGAGGAGGIPPAPVPPVSDSTKG